jgi:carbonic anhydrase/acetyltransferase-like protein (isoleucine patch superfamily)
MIVTFHDKTPRIADTAFVASTAHVSGDVRIGPQASVWFGAVLRGDEERISIGAGSNVQDNCVLHTDRGFPLILGERVVVGHRVVLHGCTVQDGALIGIGAIVLNGAVIGEGAIVAAGALVPENARIAPGQLVMGTPAREKRPVTTEEARRIADGAAHYMQIAAIWRTNAELRRGTVQQTGDPEEGS